MTLSLTQKYLTPSNVYKQKIQRIILSSTFVVLSSVPDTIIIFLEEGDTGFHLDPMTIIPSPKITQMTSQAGLYHIASNLELQRVAELLYKSNCQTEHKAIRNWQHVLSQSSNGMSLKPYFEEGYTAIRAGAGIHILQCKPVDATVDFDRKECYNELPVKLRDENGQFINETFWAHPISKILLPTPTKVPCSKTLPQIYHLDGAEHYYCSYGHGLTSCPAPKVLTPSTANLHDELQNDIAVPMGAGVLTKEKIREMQFRVFFHQYARHLQNEMLATNEKKGRIKKGLDVINYPDDSIVDKIKYSIGTAIAPFYSIFGDFYVYVIGIIMICTIFGAAVGLCSRLFMEVKVNGLTHRIGFALCQGIYHVMTVPIEFIKGGYKGASRAPMEGIDGVVNPIRTSVAQLEKEVAVIKRQRNLTPSAPIDLESGTNNQGGSAPHHNGNGNSGQAAGLFNLNQPTPGMFTPLSNAEKEELLPVNSKAHSHEGRRAAGPYVPLQQATDEARRQQASVQNTSRIHYGRSNSYHSPDTWHLQDVATMPTNDRELPEELVTEMPRIHRNPIGRHRRQASMATVECASEQPTSETLSKLDALMKGIDHATAGVNKLCSRR